MKKIIIFDFNRTIYDPESNSLVPGAEFVLQELLRRRFTLYLISRAREDRRGLIKRLGIERYFSRIVITGEKKKNDFEQMVASKGVEREASFVVGDRVRGEIALGNSCGIRTVWLKRGKFSREEPRNELEQPTHTIQTLQDVLSVAY